MGVPRAGWTLLGAIGLLAAMVGWVMLTILAPDQSVGGRVTAAGPVVTAPGVAALSGGDLTVSAVGGGQVFIGTARSDDLAAWLADAPLTRIDGVLAGDRLASGDVAGGGVTPDPLSSDIWVGSRTAASGRVELVVPRPAAQSAVAVTGADEVTLSWQRPARHPGGWPLLIGGGCLAAVAARGLVRRNAALRDARRRARQPGLGRELVGGGRR